MARPSSLLSRLPPQGFLDLKMKTWIRNLVTRLVAILPSLAVALIGGSRGAGRAYQQSY